MLPEGGCIFSVIFPPVYCLASPAFLWLLWLFGFSGFCGLLASVAFWLSAPRVFSAGDVDFNADDQAAGVDDAVAVDRNDADVTIRILIIINNVIHSVINTRSLINSNIAISASAAPTSPSASSSSSHKRKQDMQLQTENSTQQKKHTRPKLKELSPKRMLPPF